MKVEQKKYSYKWAIIGGLILYFLMAAGNSLLNLHALGALLVGTIAGAWIIFWQNKLIDSTSKKWLWGMLALFLPLLAYGILIGGLLGIIGIFMTGILPLMIWTMMAFYLIKNPKTRTKKLIIFFVSCLVLPFLILKSPIGNWIELRVKTANCESLQGVFSEQKNKCEVSRMQAVKNNLFGKQISLEAGETIVFTEKNTKSIGGSLIDDQSALSLPGNAKALTDKIYFIEDSLLAIPVVVNSGGSGTFYYAALFSDKNQSLEFLDSFFIGDRIKFESFSSKKIDEDLFHYELSVNILDRTIDEPFITEPTVKKIISKNILSDLKFSDTGIKNSDNVLACDDENSIEQCAQTESPQLETIYFDPIDKKWKDEYGVCNSCTPENGFGENGELSFK